MTGTASALLPQGACGTTAAEDDGLGIPHILTISREARAAAWNRYQPPPPIVPREVEVARAAEKKRRAYARIAKLQAKKATAKGNSGMAFAWMVWLRGYNDGPTIINRVSWER
jgi:hypothetical protein